MKKVKIVHTADLHFDTPFKDIGEKLSKIHKEELKEVFIDIINFCKREKADILLIAGDVFDNFTLGKDTLYFLENSFKNIPETKVFISPGNHDPYGNKSFYNIVNWPKNVKIFKGPLEKVVLEDLQTIVWGAAFTDKYVRESILKNFSGSSEYINIMVLHGEISNTSQGNEYNPIKISEIENSAMDYIALGHRHKFSGINKAGITSYAYSGCPQGRGFDELGDKGIIYGNISKGIVDLNFYKTSKRNYEEVFVDITNCNSNEEVINRIFTYMKNKNIASNLYKVILKGEISEEFPLDEEVLEERLKNKFYFIKVIDKTDIKIDFEKISKGVSVKSIFVKSLLEKMKEAKSEDEKEIIKMAIKIGVKSLSAEEVDINDY